MATMVIEDGSGDSDDGPIIESSGRLQFADRVVESERLLESDDTTKLISYLQRQFGDSLVGVMVYNRSRVEFTYYSPERIARYTTQELEAFADDFILQNNQEDPYQETLSPTNELQFTIHGFKDYSRLRIRLSETTGVIIVVEHTTTVTIPNHVDTFIEKIDISIRDRSSQ